MDRVRQWIHFLLCKLTYCSCWPNHRRIRDTVPWLALGELDCANPWGCCHRLDVDLQRDVLTHLTSEKGQTKKKGERRGEMLVSL
jgi:hypothetical protein